MQPLSYPKADNLLIFVGENHFGSMLTRIFMVSLRLRPVRIEREEAKGRESKEQVAKWSFSLTQPYLSHRYKYKA